MKEKAIAFYTENKTMVWITTAVLALGVLAYSFMGESKNAESRTRPSRS